MSVLKILWSVHQNHKHPEKVKRVEELARKITREFANSFFESDEDENFFNKEEIERGEV